MVKPRPARASWWWLALAVLAVAAAVVPAHAVSHVIPISGRRWADGARGHARHQLTVALIAWAVLFAVAVAALLRAPKRAAVVVSLLGGVVLGITSMARTAVLSNDLYRYAWDGKVQAAGIDPYRYAPDAHALDRLHDTWLWPPPKVCASFGQPPGCTRLNRAGVHTIYPPAAQLFFRVAHWLLPQRSHDLGYEVVGLVAATIVCALLLLTIQRSGRDVRLISLWALCPVVALEAVQNAHVDAVAVIAVVIAVLFALGSSGEPSRRRTLALAASIAVAGLVKLYPLVLLPALVRRWRIAAATVVVALFLAAYLPYVIDIGTGVTGFLRGYLSQEGYGSGTRFVLLRVIGLSGRPASVVAVLIVLGVVVTAACGRLGPPDRAALTVFTTVVFVAATGEPWYDLTLVALVAITGAWQWLGVVVGDYVGYLTTLLGGHSLSLLAIVYGGALLFGVAVTIARRTLPEPGSQDTTA